MKIVLSFLIILSIFLNGCNSNIQEGMKTESNKSDFSDITKNLAGSKGAQEARYGFLKGHVLIILAEKLNKDSSNLKVQDYIDDKGSFIPVFTSMDDYKESSKGNDLGKGLLDVKAFFLLSILNDSDRILKNPGLPDQEYFDVKELKLKFKSDIDGDTK